MHLKDETFHTLFLSPHEMGQLRVELAEFFGECEASDVDVRKYPAIDRLTDCLIHEGSNEI